MRGSTELFDVSRSNMLSHGVTVWYAVPWRRRLHEILISRAEWVIFLGTDQRVFINYVCYFHWWYIYISNDSGGTHFLDGHIMFGRWRMYPLNGRTAIHLHTRNVYSSFEMLQLDHVTVAKTERSRGLYMTNGKWTKDHEICVSIR